MIYILNILLIITYFNATHAHLWKNLLYLYSFVYAHPNYGLVEAETCKKDIINDTWLMIMNSALCKYCIFSLTYLLQGV